MKNEQEQSAAYWEMLQNIDSTKPADVIKIVNASGRPLAQVQSDLKMLKNSSICAEKVVKISDSDIIN